MIIKWPSTIKIAEYTILRSYCKKLLGVKINSLLNFNNHIKMIIKKPVRRYMFWLKLRLICVLQKGSY